MRILIIGGAGYIGSHTTKLLAAAGHEPVIFDDLSQGHEWAVKWGPLERGSLSDPARLTEVFAGRKIDAVVQALRLEIGRPGRSSGLTIRHPTAPRFETTSTSWTWPMRICERSNDSERAWQARRSTLGRAGAILSKKSSTPWLAAAANPCRPSSRRAGPATAGTGRGADSRARRARLGVPVSRHRDHRPARVGVA